IKRADATLLRLPRPLPATALWLRRSAGCFEIAPRNQRWSGLSVPIASKSPAISNALVGAVVIDQRRTARAELHRFDRAAEYVVAPDRPHLDDAAVERDHGGREGRAASRQRDPVSAGEAVAAENAGAAGEDIGDLGAAVAERVDAKYAVLHHCRIGLTAPV